MDSNADKVERRGGKVCGGAWGGWGGVGSGFLKMNLLFLKHYLNSDISCVMYEENTIDIWSELLQNWFQ